MKVFELKGVTRLSGKLKKTADMGLVRRTVRINVSELQRNMQRQANFKKGYQTGYTKRSITIKLEDAGLTARTGPQSEYSPYLVYGTRYMEAQDFFRPPFYRQRDQFIRDMSRLMK